MYKDSIIIKFPNGRIQKYSIKDFEYYYATNELEHHNENIIINVNSPYLSFVYETDEKGEITNKVPISIVTNYM